MIRPRDNPPEPSAGTLSAPPTRDLVRPSSSSTTSTSTTTTSTSLSSLGSVDSSSSSFSSSLSSSSLLHIQVPARRSLTVAVGQFVSRPTSKENTAVIISFIERAAKAGAQVVSFHETATTGYSAEAIHSNSHEALCECERAIGSACRKFSIACVVGTAHFSEREGNIKNTALVVDERGRCVCRQSKIQLVADDHWAVPGSEMCTFSLAGVECCAIICHDIRHPELVRLSAIKGAQVVFYISWETSLNDRPVPLEDVDTLGVYRAQVQARAVENNVWVVHANAAASLKDRTKGSHGMSRIVSPTGHIMIEATPEEERLLVHKADLQLSHRSFALESMRSSYFLRDWCYQGVEEIVDASMPPESPIIGPRSRSVSPSSPAARIGGRKKKKRSAFASASRSTRSSPAASPSLNMYKRRRIESIPTDYSSSDSDAGGRSSITSKMFR